jgi:hypothetical protein
VKLVATPTAVTVVDDAVVDLFGNADGGNDWIFFQGDGAGDENGASANTVLPPGFIFGTDLR